MTDHQNEAFDHLAEMIFWGTVCTVLVMVVGACFVLVKPEATLNDLFWPVLGVVASVGIFFGLYLRSRKTVVIKDNVVGGDIVAGDLVIRDSRGRVVVGHKQVEVDLNQLNKTLGRPHMQARPPTRTPDQYSRSSDIKPADTYSPPAFVPHDAYDSSLARTAYADTDRCSSPSYDSGSSYSGSSYSSCDSGSSGDSGGGGGD